MKTDLGLEAQVLFEIALSIGDSMSLEPMLRKVLDTALRLTGGRGAAVYQRCAEGEKLSAVMSLPGWFARSEVCKAFVGHVCDGGATMVPRVERFGGDAYHAIPLPGFGLLLLCRTGEAFPASFLDALCRIGQKLAAASRACLLEEALRSQTERLELATRAAEIGVWEWHAIDGKLIWDDRMHSLYDVPETSFKGEFSDWEDRVHPEDRDRARMRFDMILETDARFDIEFRVVRRNGEVRYLRGVGLVVRNEFGEAERAIGINYDVTDRVMSTRAVHDARDAALQASEAKSRFLAHMSHEVRTPLNGILGLCSVLGESGLKPEQAEHLALIERSAGDLQRMLEEVLDYARVERGDAKALNEQFSPRAVLAEAVRAPVEFARTKGVSLCVDLDALKESQAIGDPIRLGEVLTILCDNAIKFTEEGEVWVRAWFEQVSPGPQLNLCLEVCDTGIGIPPDKHERIFEPFAQVDSGQARHYGGAGLGLSICASLVELMGGNIDLHSTLGEGSRFLVRVPLKACASPEKVRADALLGSAVASELEPALSCHERALNVLVAEDHPINQHLMRFLLGSWGHSVKIVEDGQKLLQALSASRFDLLLIDLHMPGMDGLTALRTLRATPGGGERIPVVVITADSDEAQRSACLSAGANGFLVKPFSPEHLHEIVARLSATA